MGGISFLEGKWKWEKNNVILLVFSTGDFERVYLGFSGRIHMQIIDSSNFKISREMCGGHCELPSVPCVLHPASSLRTKPAEEGIYFLISFQGSPYYFWENLVFRKFFCLLNRKSISLRSLPIDSTYTFLILLIVFNNFTIGRTGAEMG